jgi:hypothetical protein
MRDVLSVRLFCCVLASRSIKPPYALIGLLPGLDDLEVFSVFGLSAKPPQPIMLFHVCPRKGKPHHITPALARLPTPAPSCIPAAAAANELDDEKEYQCPDRGIDNGRDDAGAEVNAEAGQHPAADKGTNHSNDEVADDAETGPLHDLTSQPSGDKTDQQYEEKAFT